MGIHNSRLRIIAVGILLAVLVPCGLAAGVTAKPNGLQPTQVTLDYNRTHGFFYGEAKMPRKTDGSGEFACLEGNRHFPEGPRLLQIYRVGPGPDRAISPTVAAEARPESGALVWKFERKPIAAGRYYVVFEEQQPLAPYQPSECPGFRSRATLLPRPQAP